MKNIKLNFGFVCDYAFFSEGQKLNIIGTFKNISVSSVPAKHSQMFIVTNASVDESGDYEQVLKLVREEDGVELNNIKINLTVNKVGDEPAELGFLGQLNDLVFEKEGKYSFKLFINGDLIGEVPLQITKI